MYVITSAAIKFKPVVSKNDRNEAAATFTEC